MFLRYDDYFGLVKEEYRDCSFNYFINRDVAGGVLPHTDDLFGAYVTDLSEDGLYQKLVISLNDNEYTEKIGAYDADFYIGTIGGENYLFVDMLHENDYESLNVYYMNSNTGKVELAAKDIDGGFYGTIPSDPLEFRIYTRGDVLSTYDTYKYYYISRTGEPVSSENYYFVDTDMTLTTKVDIEAEVRDSFDGTGSMETVKKGEKLHFYASDNETWVDFKLNDGRFVRIILDKAGWPQTIDGVDAVDIFDGIMHAG